MKNENLNPGGTVWSFTKDLRDCHMLIAGTTGSGKSVIINDILWSHIGGRSVANSLILIDPKRVELSPYKNTPHCYAYAQTPGQAVSALKLALEHIEADYKKLEAEGKRKKETDDSITIVIDELADLMLSDRSAEIKRLLQKILQIGRAVKCYVIAATQCPNRKVIPAELVLNFTCRWALRCMSSIESRQIIGIAGAEQICNYGEAIENKNGMLTRYVDLPMTSDEDIRERLAFWKD